MSEALTPEQLMCDAQMEFIGPYFAKIDEIKEEIAEHLAAIDLANDSVAMMQDTLENDNEIDEVYYIAKDYLLYKLRELHEVARLSHNI